LRWANPRRRKKTSRPPPTSKEWKQSGRPEQSRHDSDGPERFGQPGKTLIGFWLPGAAGSSRIGIDQSRPTLRKVRKRALQDFDEVLKTPEISSGTKSLARTNRSFSLLGLRHLMRRSLRPLESSIHRMRMPKLSLGAPFKPRPGLAGQILPML
jgi:hypothetical protein